MAFTTFTSGTTIASDWLNDVNASVYGTPTAVTNGVVNVKDSPYFAVGNGVADDTSAIQSAIYACQQSGYSLYLPAGTYKTTATLTITARLHMYGDGAGVSIIQTSSAAECIKVTVPLGYGNTFSYFNDFGIQPATAGGGTNGLACVLTSAGASYSYMSNFVIERVYVGDFGNYGLYLNNTVANADGFFTGTIHRCWISNGINLYKVGDSINIEENTITDGAHITTAHAGGNVGIIANVLSGARQVVIRSNNITTSGGAIAITSGEQVRIENNQCEFPFFGYDKPYGASNSATVAYNALIYLYNATYTEIRGNTIQPGGVASYATKSTTGTLNTTTTVSTVASMTGIYVGCSVSGTNIPIGARVLTVGASSFTMSLAATGSASGVALTIGYSPDYALLMEGSSAYNLVEMNDIFKGTVYHIGLNAPGTPTCTLGLGNTYNEPPGQSPTTPILYNPSNGLTAWGLPKVTTATLPSATTFTGGIIYDTTTSSAKISDGTSWSPIFSGTNAPTMDSIFVNNLVDLWSVNGKVVGPPDRFTLGAGTAVAESTIVWPANLTATSIKYTQASATLTNSLRVFPNNQPWLNTETLSVLVALYMPVTANRIMRVYRDFNGATLPLGDVTADGNWGTVQASFSITAGQNNWGLYVAILDSTVPSLPVQVASGVCYVGGVNIVRGNLPPQTLSDSAARRAYVATSVTYAPPFQGCRAFIAGTGKWYMAADQSAPGDWIILN